MLNLTPAVVIGRSLYQSADWVDFVASSRFTVPLSQKALIDILDDAGKGGASLDYQVAGLLGYQIKPKNNLLAGWRYLTVHYRGNNQQFVIDTSPTGFIIGTTYRWR
jgi:hypothetical protein